jgi:hypothetical protein
MLPRGNNEQAMQAPTIDKVHLKAADFSTVNSNLQWVTDTRQSGDRVTVKRFLNLPGLTIEVKADKQGSPAAWLQFNPNLISMKQIETYCNQAGVRLNVWGADVIRADYERTARLNYAIETYHPIIRAAAKTNITVQVYRDTITAGTRTGQVSFYDKSRQAGLSTSGIVRAEIRYLKPALIRRAGIVNLQDLMQADRSDMYRAGGSMFLPKLSIVPTETADIARGIELLQQCYESSTRPLTTFLSLVGIEHTGMDTLYRIIGAAGITKQQRYAARQQLSKIAGQFITGGFNADMKAELLQFFAA